MKVFTFSTAVLLNTLALLTPSTEAAPISLMEARALPPPVSVAIAKKYLASRTFLLRIVIRDHSSLLDH